MSRAKVVCIAAYRRKLARKKKKALNPDKAAADYARQLYRDLLPLVRAV